ncbi:MAG: hypothetical protein K6F81_03000 [Acholeplasmatales bacterium]|nr:hypothetical protein [Acholeplasmatales bacterium]
MKKILILLIFIPLFLISCSKNSEEINISDDEISGIEEKMNNINNGEEDNTEKVKLVSDYSNDIEAINEFVDRFSKINKYKKIAKGITKTLINQDIDCYVSRDGNKYVIYNTSSSSYHEAIFDNKITYRNDKDDEFKEINISDYKKEYGVTPYDDTLFDYVINESTVSKIERTIEDDKYTFTIDINVESDATKYLKVQMKKLANVSEYPVFKSAKLSLTLNNDFTPISGHIDATYSIHYMFFDVDCEQSLDLSFEF